MTKAKIRHPLRMLLLPARVGTEAECGQALEAELQALGVGIDDFLNWVSLRLEEWRSSGNPHGDLVRVARCVILAACADAPAVVKNQGILLAEGYFTLHSRLINDHLMRHEEAVAFLSHSFLIAHLASLEQLSAAQISNLLTERDHRAKFSRQAVASALATMKTEPVLTRAQITELYQQDSASELSEFADAGFGVAAEMIAEAGSKLGFSGDLLSALRTLSPVEQGDGISSQFTPYLQMLHYQCCIAEFFDHAITDVYEFSPRGEAANWLFGQYPDTVAGAANPFLNNAKSVEVLDSGWVRAKKNKERPGAMALLILLEGMQAMGFFARRELAWWIRLWICRIIRVSSALPLVVPNELTEEQVRRLFGAIRSGNTATYGIIEQRVVDAMASLAHLGWRARGIGDAVNATNISRAKLGDCEFLNASDVSVSAYESHGGELSAIYVDEHVATLKKAILRRVDELNAIADLEDWTATITFVAHTIVGLIPTQVLVHGLKIKIIAITFEEFIERSARDISPDIIDAINTFVLIPFREQRTPNIARERLVKIVGE